MASLILGLSGSEHLKNTLKNSETSKLIFTHLFQGGKTAGMKQKLFKVYLLAENKDCHE